MKRHCLGIGSAVVSALLVVGCASTTNMPLAAPKVEPVYRFNSPDRNYDGLFALGRFELGKGNAAAAIDQFRKALEVRPGDVSALNALGVAYAANNQIDESVAAFRDAITAAPTAAHLYSNLGFAQMKAGRLVEAQTSLQESVRLDPTNVKTRENIALLEAAKTKGPVLAAAPTQWTTPAAEPGLEAKSAAGAQSARAIQPVAGAQHARVARTEPIVQSTPAAAPRRAQAVDIAPSSSAESRLIQVSPGVYELREKPASTTAIAAVVREQSATARSAPAPVSPAAVAAAPAAEVLPAPVSPKFAVQPPAATVVALVVSDSTAHVPTAPQPSAAAATTVPSAKVATQASSPAVVLTPPTVPPPRTAARMERMQVTGLEISNGVGTRGLAGQAARGLRGVGFAPLKVSDYIDFKQTRTRILYRPGHMEEAKALKAVLPGNVVMIPVKKLLAPDINVRLVIGHDLDGKRIIAWVNSPEVILAGIEAEWAAVHGKRLDLSAYSDAALRFNPEDGWRWS